ncbi:MAG: SAM-dependent DNA methyltransferase [Planctomycetaceae bacterium]|nr:SAM-dependent DNA methyltransferase [Planctomycetaceae bacterium]
MTREAFHYPDTGKLLTILDTIARRSGVSRARAFEDFLHMSLCALAGGTMEEEYLQTVARHTAGTKGERGADLIARMFAELILQMEHTRGEMKDVLGDLFQGAITYGEAGQFLTPEAVCRAMARLTIGESLTDQLGERRTVSDPCCGSGRMLLAVAEIHRDWKFIGQDVDLRCVRMTAINLALRNLYGTVIHGDTLKNKRKLVYHTGFNGRGFVRPILLQEAAPQSPILAESAPVAAIEPIVQLPPARQRELF